MFEFINNDSYREILIRDFEELEKCIIAEASKAVVVLSGSIIESIFVEYFISNPPTGKTKEQVLRLKLFQLIDLAEETGLISKKIKELSSVVRDYRNYIHPAKEIRMNEFIDMDTATIAYSLLKLIINEVEQKYTKLYGMTAEKLFNKLRTDSSAYSIFGRLISKTNESELTKLVDLITNNYIENNNSTNNLRVFTTRYLSILKRKIGDDSIRKYLFRLKDEVKHGKKEVALILFDLYGERLILLGQDSVDLIIDYMYSVVGQCSFLPNENLIKLKSTNFYENLIIYNNKNENKKKYLKIILSIVKNIHRKDDEEHWRYIDLFKSLTDHMETKLINDYLKRQVGEEIFDKFQRLVEKNDDGLPF